MVQHETIAALDLRAAELEKPSGVTLWIVPSVCRGQGAPTLIPGWQLSARPCRAQAVCVCAPPCTAPALLPSCSALKVK